MKGKKSKLLHLSISSDPPLKFFYVGNIPADSLL